MRFIVILFLCVAGYVVATSCDARAKWRQLVPGDPLLDTFHSKLTAIMTVPIATWDAQRHLALRQLCYDTWFDGPREGETYFRYNQYPCEGYGILPGGSKAVLFARVWDGRDALNTDWHGAAAMFYFDRYEGYRCYNRSFDAVWYYFHSGRRAEIDAMFCPYPTMNSLTGCCYFDIDSYPECPAGQVKQCDPAFPCVSAYAQDDAPDPYKIPDLSGARPWMSPALLQAATAFFTAGGGHSEGFDLNSQCVGGQTTFYDPASNCTKARNGCYTDSCDTAPGLPCGGHGYCTPSPIYKTGVPEYMCECQRYGDVPYWMQSDDYLTSTVPKYGGNSKYYGYACQRPGAALVCLGTGGICNGIGNCSSHYMPSQECGTLHGTTVVDWIPACDCSGTAFTGAQCTDSRCRDYSGNPDPLVCHSGENHGACENEGSNTWSCRCNPGWIGLNCELSDAPCRANKAAPLLCSGGDHGRCMYNHTVSQQTGVHCDCSVSYDAELHANLAWGQYCEQTRCDPNNVFEGHGRCQGTFAYVSDAVTCYQGVDGCTTSCHPVFKSSSSRPLYCDTDVCASYGGTGYVLPNGGYGACACNAPWTVNAQLAPTNYLINNNRLANAGRPECVPRCYNDCKIGNVSATCEVTVVENLLSDPFRRLASTPTASARPSPPTRRDVARSITRNS